MRFLLNHGSESGCLALLALMAAPLLSSCTLSATAYPAAGPAARIGKTCVAKFTWAGGGSGKITITLPSGEVCTGRYATVIGGVVDPDIAASAGSASASASVSTDDIRGLQTSRAMLAGNRGTIIDFEGYTSGANPTHGFGRAKDNVGSMWKVIW